VCGRLVQHLLQGGAAAFDKVAVKAANGLLLGRGWYDVAGVVSMKGSVEPEEVTITALDLKLRLLVSLGRGLL
jgi:hypothetical protein